VGLTLVLLLLFPRFTESSVMQRFAAAVTAGTAYVLSILGVPAVAHGFLLRSGAVTLDVLPGCVATPLLILYVALALVWPLSWKGKGLLVALCLPFFYLLNVVRVIALVLAEAALPDLAVGRPGEFLYDFFFQLCLLGGMTLGMGGWISNCSPDEIRGNPHPASWIPLRFIQATLLRLALGYGGALVVWQLGGRAYEALVFGSHEMILGEMGVALPESLPHDPNRVLSYLPAFQMVIFLAFTFAFFGLWRWQHLVLGGLWLYLSQLFFLLSLSFFGLAFHYFPHVRYLRAWVLAVPFLLVWLLWHRGQARAGAA
jgi:exosortase/archaeosortase family protein